MQTASSLQVALLIALVAGPILAGLLAWLIPAGRGRNVLIHAAAALTAAGGVVLIALGPASFPGGAIVGPLAKALEGLIVLAVLGIALRQRLTGVLLLGLLQAGIVGYEFLHPASGSVSPAFILDTLAAILVGIISIIGSLIVVFAVGYMERHSHHAPASAASTGRFFFFLIGFLGLMNGLVLTNHLGLLSFFWEGTTLCSFFLIGQDGTDEARKNSRLALLLNLVGGVALSLGSALAGHAGVDGSVSGLIASGALAPVALLVIATCTKSAQMPFQSWLLGAMVAPTPVSALLHSSTMVKAGSYLVLRLAPGFIGTPLADFVAVVGAFTFAVTSALAISQSNAKRVLAYSTIANLGLIMACASLNSPLAYAAAILLLIYHALSKALLFLCVGTVEQEIGSRDIDDMSGLLFKMPFTTTFAVVGMVSMMAPPFGMLIGKWMAVTAAGRTPLVLVLMVLGSALTIFFWAKWMGRILTTSWHDKYESEVLPGTMKFVLTLLTLAVVVGGAVPMTVYRLCARPLALTALGGLRLQSDSMLLLQAVDAFMDWPMFLLVALAVFIGFVSVASVRKAHVKPPFLCGENVADSERSHDFRSAMDAPSTALVKSYYLTGWFGEAVMTRWANYVAALLLLTLLVRMTPLWMHG